MQTRQAYPATQANGVVRLVPADDHQVIRQSLRLLLESRPDVTVVGECGNGREAVAMVEKLHPAIVLMDIAMPELSGIEATRQIRHVAPATRIIMLSAYGDAEHVRLAVRAGASGYIIKRSDIDELVMAIKLVSRGNTYFANDLAEHLDLTELMYEAKRPEQNSPLERLTTREREVLQLIAEGHTGKGIAARLVISPKTVEGHKTRLMTKLGAQNRTDLLRFAFKAELISLDEDSPNSHATAS